MLIKEDIKTIKTMSAGITKFLSAIHVNRASMITMIERLPIVKIKYVSNAVNENNALIID